MPALFDSTSIHPERAAAVSFEPALINSTSLSRATVAKIAQQRADHAQARARQAEDIATTAAEIRRLQAHLLEALIDGDRLGIAKTELGRLSGVARLTIYRWLAKADADHTEV
jgi:hypothetical protein